ncbi:hypothetical protein CAL14_17805 [Bordetella genomosp. 9]|uniref:DUF3426 domain-containing protein n=1 Tax=Bordetella genomosp. 9 TaxID=1416803 RepID=UPI000A291D04|nr:DUF3426 domain-containing protein [Bordetella genomosp. 9]ARP91912.1 hypothetical protein CAL14_17805 [Bordetella genomosp. 9]
MAMTTRCPHCGTAFKVVADQLRVRNGLVRCGVCSRVFDGYAAIVDESGRPAPVPAPSPVRASAPGAVPPPEATSPVLSVKAADSRSAGYAPESPPASVIPPRPESASPERGAAPRPPWEPERHTASREPWESAPAAPTPPAEPAGPAAARPPWEPEHPAPPRPSWETAHQGGSYTPSESPRLIRSGRRPESARPSEHRSGFESSHRDEPVRAPGSPRGFAPRPEAVRTQPPPRAPYVGAAAPPAEPAVLRGRDDSHRVGTHRVDPLLPSGYPPGRQPAGDDERYGDPYADRDADRDVYGDPYGEPYAPYRQDDLDDAEQQARDLHLSGDDRRDRDEPAVARPGIYARREPDEDAPDYIPIPGEVRTRYDDADTGMAPPIFMDEEVHRRRAWIARLWGIGCLIGLLVLGLQWVYIYRTSIATAVPALRPALESVCAQMGCQVGYVRRLERISITASSLQPQSGAAADDGQMRLVLRVTMRNRYDKPQPWPAFMLQLTDLSDTVVVRKAILPENYLPPGAQGPFPAGGERSIAVPVQVNGLHVNGYQLDKFFP